MTSNTLLNCRSYFLPDQTVSFVGENLQVTALSTPARTKWLMMAEYLQPRIGTAHPVCIRNKTPLELGQVTNSARFLLCNTAIIFRSVY